MTSYINACDVTVANSNLKMCYNFFSECTCAPPLWRRFCHLCHNVGSALLGHTH